MRRANAEYLKSVFADAEVNIVPGGEHALPVVVPELIDMAVERIYRFLLARNGRKTKVLEL